MNVVVLAVASLQFSTEIGTDLLEDAPQRLDGGAIEHMATVLRHKDQMDVQSENAGSTPAKVA